MYLCFKFISMKKYLTALLLSASLFSMSIIPVKLKSDGSISSCQWGQCSYIKRNGEQCQNCCQQFSIYCWSHNR